MTPRTLLLSAALFAGLATTAPGHAAVDVDPAGMGFIGRGDVMAAYGWDHAAFNQYQTSMQFALRSDVAVRWSCRNPAGNHVQRERLTRTTAVLSVEPRYKAFNAISGWFALGFVPGSQATSVTGHALYSCPGGHVFNKDPQTSELGAVVSANFGGKGWTAL